MLRLMKIFNRGSEPSATVSLIPFLFLVIVLGLVIKVFGTDALSGASQVALMFAAGVTVVIAMVLYKIPWKTFEEAILDNITSPDWSCRRFLDGQWCGSYHDLLWHEGYLP